MLLDAYYPGKELEIDVLTDGENVYVAGIFEHVEKAGVHSGDSMAVTPPYSLTEEVKQTILAYTQRIAKGMDFKGIFNVQFVLYKGELYVIEINPRASRTVPIFSKVTGVSLIDATVQLLLGSTLAEVGLKPGYPKEQPFLYRKSTCFLLSEVIWSGSST